MTLRAEQDDWLASALRERYGRKRVLRAWERAASLFKNQWQDRAGHAWRPGHLAIVPSEPSKVEWR